MTGNDDIFGGAFGAGDRPETDMPGLSGVPGLAGPETVARNFKGLRMLRNSPLLDETLRYWTSLREGDAIPRRSAMDPQKMQLILGHAMILDQLRHGTVRIRLGGHAMERLMGMSARGLPIRALFDTADRTRAVDLFGQVFDTPATLELDLISEGMSGLVTGRMLVLPMLDAAGRVTKALTVMVTDRVVKGPRRFSVTNATLLPLPAAPGPTDAPRRRRQDAQLPQPEELDASLHEMAEPSAEFEGRPSSVPWLRVIK